MTAPPGDDSVTALIGSLAEDARSYAHAEWRFYRAVAAARIRAGRTGFVLVALALFTAHAGIIALAVGALIALTPSAGGWGATGIVVGVAVIAAAVLGWLGWTRLARMADPIE